MLYIHTFISSFAERRVYDPFFLSFKEFAENSSPVLDQSQEARALQAGSTTATLFASEPVTVQGAGMCRPPFDEVFAMLIRFRKRFSTHNVSHVRFVSGKPRCAVLVPGALGAAMPTTQSATQCTPSTPRPVELASASPIRLSRHWSVPMIQSPEFPKRDPFVPPTPFPSSSQQFIVVDNSVCLFVPFITVVFRFVCRNSEIAF